MGVCDGVGGGANEGDFFSLRLEVEAADGVLDAVGEGEVLFVAELEEGPGGVADFLMEVGEVAVVDQFSDLLLEVAEAFAEGGLFEVLVVALGDEVLEVLGVHGGIVCVGLLFVCMRGNRGGDRRGARVGRGAATRNGS